MIDLTQTPRRLKQSILMEAMQGKLTKQLPGDGNASDLLVKIANYKRDLVQNGRLKGYSKPLPPVKDNEKPFNIPNNWQWTKIGNLCLYNIGGNTPSKHNLHNWDKNGIPWLSVKDIDSKYKNDSKEHISVNASKRSAKIIPPYSFIAVVRMAIGEYTINTVPLAINQDLRALIIPKTILPWLSSIYGSFRFKGKGATVKGITKKQLLNTLIPLPPLTEQKRIVQRLDQILPKIDSLNRDVIRLHSIRKVFPHRLKQSLLMEAMQGKLTKQLPSDGNADELLQKIQQKKQFLIKAGKIRRHKKLPPISKDEIPFKIPKNWKWVNLDEIGYVTSGGTPRKSINQYWNSNDIPWLTPKYLGENRYNIVLNNCNKYISKQGLYNSSAQLIRKGSIIYSSRAPIGYLNIVNFNYSTNQGAKSFTPILVNSYYIYYALIERTQSIKKRASGTTFKEISGTKFRKTLLPIPPLNEQERIANVIQKCFSLI